MTNAINIERAIDTRDAIDIAIEALEANNDTSGAIDTLRMMCVQNVEGIDPAATLLPELCDVLMFG